jgi:hypothetical protein
MDGNGRKNPVSISILYLLAETGLGSENAGSEMETGNTCARKRTNTDGIWTEVVGGRNLSRK